MNRLFHNFLKNRAEQRLKCKAKAITPNSYNNEFHKARIEIKHLTQDVILIILGIVAAAFGLKGFLMPNLFIDGGVTGISMIVSKVSGLSLSTLLILINSPFIIIGYKSIGKQFAIKSIVAIAALAIMIHIVEFPAITHDKLLIAGFGGFFLGLGIGLSMRGGAVLDGTEVLAVFVSRKLPTTIGGVILTFNIMIFSVAAYIFDLETAMYAILTYLAASKTVDFVVNGIEEYVGVTIISEKSEQIREAIINNLGRGCTLYDGKRGFSKKNNELVPTQIIYSLVTRLELSKLQAEIDKIDENAFVIMHSIKDAKGGMIKKRPLKEY